MQVNQAKITFFMPAKLVEAMKEKMQEEGYGVKDKSRWIAEAIEKLEKIDNFIELVNYSNDMSDINTQQTIRVSRELKQKLGKLVIDVKKQFFELDGVQSRVIRTSILQRVLRN